MKKRNSVNWPEEIIDEYDVVRLNTDITIWDEPIILPSISVSGRKSQQWNLCDGNG